VKVLIADDDSVSLSMLDSIMGGWHYETVLANDGNEAWERLHEADAPQLVILDWMMPGMDGVEICQKIRKEEALQNIRQNEKAQSRYIVLLTGRDNKKDIIEGLEAGANDYVTKPFDSGELRARIDVGRRVLELKSMLAKRIDELQEALSHIKQLQGIIPICMYCKKIRDDQESWERIEEYITERSDAQFSHGVCPDCYERELAILKNKMRDRESDQS